MRPPDNDECPSTTAAARRSTSQSESEVQFLARRNGEKAAIDPPCGFWLISLLIVGVAACESASTPTESRSETQRSALTSSTTGTTVTHRPFSSQSGKAMAPSSRVKIGYRNSLKTPPQIPAKSKAALDLEQSGFRTAWAAEKSRLVASGASPEELRSARYRLKKDMLMKTDDTANGGNP